MQTVSFTGECIAIQNARDAGIPFRKGEYQAENTVALIYRVGFVADNAAHAGENRVFDKVDQTFIHSGFTREVPIERSFGNAEFCRQSCGCNTSTA